LSSYELLYTRESRESHIFLLHFSCETIHLGCDIKCVYVVSKLHDMIRQVIKLQGLTGKSFLSCYFDSNLSVTSKNSTTSTLGSLRQVLNRFLASHVLAFKLG